MNSRGENDHVRAKHLLHESYRYCGSFINNQEFSLSQLSIVLRLYVLNRLPVVFEDINTDYSMVEVRVCRLKDVIVGMLSIVKRV